MPQAQAGAEQTEVNMELPDVFNPYEPGAFANARADAARLRDPRLRNALSRLLDRLEADPDFCARWYKRQLRERQLFRRFGPQLAPVGKPKPSKS